MIVIRWPFNDALLKISSVEEIIEHNNYVDKILLWLNEHGYNVEYIEDGEIGIKMIEEDAILFKLTFKL